MQTAEPSESTRYVDCDKADDLTPGQLATFILCCSSVLFAYNPTMGGAVPPISLVAWTFVLFGFFALWKEKPRLRVWIAWGVASVATVAATTWVAYARFSPINAIVVSDYRPAVVLAGMILATSVALLSAFRFSAIVYVVLAVALGLEALTTSRSAVVGLAVTTIYVVLLVAVNYVVKLFIDHNRDVRLLFKSKRGRIKASDIIDVVIHSIGPLAIILFLVGIGVLTHDQLQARFKTYIYSSQILPRSEQGVADQDRDMRLDSYAAIDSRAKEIRDVFREKLSAQATNGKLMVDDVPRILSEIVGQHGLAAMNSSGCDALHIEPPRLFGKSIGGGIGTFADMCRNAASSFHSSLSATFATATRQLLNQARSAANNAKDSISLSEERAQEYGDKSIAEAKVQARASIDNIFSILDAMYVIGLAVLISAVLGAASLVLARRVFNPAGKTPFSLGIEGASRVLELVDLHNGRDGASMIRPGLLEDSDTTQTKFWYVTSHDKLIREGEGWEGPVIPQPFRCLLQRMPSRWVMQRLNVNKARMAGDSGAEFGSSEKSKFELVCLRVRPGQQLVLKIGSLVAFSDGVKFNSSYSTHVGLYLLGLGAFQTFVEGDGWLVLGLNDGSFRLSQRGKDFVYPSGIVCWDRRARFMVSHTLNAGRHWFTDSQVIPHSKAGSVLIGQSGTTATGLWPYFGRLAGYLLLPY